MGFFILTTDYQLKMNEQLRLKLSLELVWWLVTALIVLAVMFPMLRIFKSYPFLWSNVAFIVIFVTFSRYILLLKNTFLARLTWLKVLLIAICIPLVFNLISTFYAFQIFIDEEGTQSLFSLQYLREQVPLLNQESMANYIRTETIFFAVGSIITTILMPIRMIRSIWRTYNTEDRV